MPPEDIEALRTGAKLSNQRHEGLKCFTKALIRTQGKVAQAELNAFFAVGYSPQQALEVILGIAIKTMSNYTNSITGTPLDKIVESYQWQKPTIKPRKE